MRLYAEGIGMSFDAFQFLVAEAAGVHDDAVHLVAQVLRQVFNAKAGVQTTAESQDEFLSGTGSFIHHIHPFIRS